MGQGCASNNHVFLSIEKDLTALYEGDIVVIPKKTKVSDIPGGKETLQDAINEKRNTVDDKRNLWVGKVVPYMIQPELGEKERRFS